MFIDDKLNSIAEAYKKMKMKAEAEDPAAKPVGGDKPEDEKKDDVEEACTRKGKKEALDPVGKADADVDNDGDVDDSDEYLANRRKAIKKSMKKESVELTESSTRDYVDNIMPRALKKAGIDCKVSKKAGYTSYKCGDYEIVNDGVGIKVKENGKEVAYYSKPKLDYKKAVEKINEEVEVVAEAKFNKGDSVKIKNVKKYDALAKDDEGTVIGMASGKVMVKIGTGQMNVDPKDLIRESAELTEAKGYYIEVSVRHARKANEILQDQFRNMYKTKGSNHFIFKDEADAYDAGMTLMAQEIEVTKENVGLDESVQLEEGKKLRNVLSDKEFEKSMKKALADKGNYKGGKVNWNFIDADVYMELSAKGYDLRHPSINYMDRFDKLADKLDPAMNESVEQIDEVTFTIPKSKAGADYMSRKAKERQDQHKKQDPKHAKTHARNMVDIDKAEKKAAKKGVKMRDYGKDAWKVRNGVKRGKLPENSGYKSETLKNLVSDLSEAKVSMDAVTEIMANAKRPEDAVKMIVKKFKVSAKEAEKLMAKALGE